MSLYPYLYGSLDSSTYHDLPPRSRTPPPPRNSRPYDQGLLCNHWFPLVRPASKPLISEGGMLEGGLVD